VDNAKFMIFVSVVNILGLLCILPLLSYKLKVHDALLLAFCTSTETAGLLMAAFCTELWQFYIAHGLQMMGFCKYGLVRALLSKCINTDETGKVFSALAILGAFAPMASNPIFRQLYNQTLDTFPAAEILLAAAIMLVSSMLNFVVYTQRWRILPKEPTSEIQIDVYGGQNNHLKKRGNKGRVYHRICPWSFRFHRPCGAQSSNSFESYII
jgi:hypothetical protein